MTDNLSRAMKITVWYLVAAATSYVVQAIPSPLAVFSMMLGGALWVSIILNLMLIHLTVAATVKAIPRQWLLVPLASYGTWAILVIANAAAAAKTVQFYEAENLLDLAIPTDMPLILDESDLRFAIQITQYVVGGPVFAGDYEIKVDAGRKWCSGNEGDGSLAGFHASGDYAKGACVFKTEHEPPAIGLYFHKIQEIPYGNNGPRTVYSLELVDRKSDSKRVVGNFEFGEIERMSAWPLFAAGCGLISSGTPSWACFQGALKDRIKYGAIDQGPSYYSDSIFRDDYYAAALAKVLNRPSRHYVPMWGDG